MTKITTGAKQQLSYSYFSPFGEDKEELEYEC